jgi:hypothetical protein
MLDERTQLNSETEQIQQILTIVEGLRQQPSPLAEDHLIAELHRIFCAFGGLSGSCPRAETAASTPPDEEGEEEEEEQQEGSRVAAEDGTRRLKEASRLVSLTIVRNVLTWARRHLAAQSAQADDQPVRSRSEEVATPSRNRVLWWWW